MGKKGPPCTLQSGDNNTEHCTHTRRRRHVSKNSSTWHALLVWMKAWKNERLSSSIVINIIKCFDRAWCVWQLAGLYYAPFHKNQLDLK